MILLTRDDFRASVFERDRNRCVLCGKPGKDAHHIMERRLFDDGGYYRDNGATLCEPCHLDAEKTIVSPDQVRAAAGIVKVILPPHLYPDYDYTKWGDIQNANGTRIKGELFYDESVQKVLAAAGVLDLYQKYVKYPRTFHLPFSHGRTEDDRALSDCSIFEGKEVVVTAKLDGENTTGYWDGYVHARSLDSESDESQSWVRRFLSTWLFELPSGYRVCGENLFAKHSIHYHGLPTYFHLFSIWDDMNNCLSWDHTLEWAGLLNLHTVPILYRGLWDESLVSRLFQPTLDGNEMEGFVVRNATTFRYGDFRRNVAKFVRADHVRTNEHWKRTELVKNELI